MLLLHAAHVAAQDDTIVYGANSYNFNQMIEVNLTQGSEQLVATTPFGTQAMAQDPVTGFVYFYEWQQNGNEFAYWDPSTGNFTTVRTYSPSPGLYAKRMDFAPDGTLYMIDNAEGLHTIDKTNGDLVAIGTLTGLETGPYAATGDMAFAPDGTFYIVNYRSLYTVDIATLVATRIYTDMIPTFLPGMLAVWTGVAHCDGFLYATSAEESIGASRLFRIDPATGSETLIYTSQYVMNDLSSCSAVPVPPPNRAPVAFDQTVQTEEQTSVEITLSATDADGDTLSLSILTPPASGALVSNGADQTYTPNPGFTGTDTFEFVANDGEADSNIATVSVFVAATPPPDSIIYGANAYDRNQMIQINLTQSGVQIADGLPFGTAAIAQDPGTGRVYFYEWEATADEFAYWDPATGITTVVRTYAPSPGIAVQRMDFAPDGTLYMIDNAEVLYTIDPATGNITTLGTLTGMETGPYGATGDMAFAPDGTLYVVSYRSLYSVDLSTLAATLLYTGMIQTSTPNQIAIWTGVGYCDGLLYASSAEQATGLSGIFSIDPATGQEIYLFSALNLINDLASCVPPPE
ncbi:MAG: Ig-like domain-containing protein [Pseudomonadota bacterium]